MAARDLTTGPIPKHLIALATPVFLAMLLQSAYALIDLAWVGTLGEDAVAGLSISLQAFFIILAISQVLATTALAGISQAYGERRLAMARGLLTSYSLVAVGTGVVAALFAFASADIYVGVFTSDPLVYELGVDYFRVTSITFLVQLLLMVFGSSLRASGDFTTPMRIMFVSVGVNLVLDPMLIFGWGPFPELGLAGAAWATVVAQTTACLLYAARLARRRHRDPRAIYWCRPVWPRGFFRGLLVRGLPAGVQFFLLSAVLGIVLGAMKPHGPAWTATAGGGFRVLQQTFLPMIALASASAALAGQNIGARLAPRVQLATRTTIRWGLAYGLVAALALFFGGAVAARIFASGPEEIALGAEYFRWSAPALLAFAVTYIPTFVLQAAGRAILPMMAATLRVALLAALVFWVIPATDLPPEYVFGAVTLTAFVEGVAGYGLLRLFLRHIRVAFAGAPDATPAPVVPDALHGAPEVDAAPQTAASVNPESGSR